MLWFWEIPLLHTLFHLLNLSLLGFFFKTCIDKLSNYGVFLTWLWSDSCMMPKGWLWCRRHDCLMPKRCLIDAQVIPKWSWDLERWRFFDFCKSVKFRWLFMLFWPDSEVMGVWCWKDDCNAEGMTVWCQKNGWVMPNWYPIGAETWRDKDFTFLIFYII
jgi:hypothetical protein